MAIFVIETTIGSHDISSNHRHTVKRTHAVTSIKESPVLKGHIFCPFLYMFDIIQLLYNLCEENIQLSTFKETSQGKQLSPC